MLPNLRLPWKRSKKIPDAQELKDTIKLETEFLKNHKDVYDYGRAIEFLQKEGTPPTGLALVRSYFSGIMSAVRGISSVICFVSSAVSLLKVLGVIKSEADPRFTSIDDSVKEIQAKVDDIDRKADRAAMKISAPSAAKSIRITSSAG